MWYRFSQEQTQEQPKDSLHIFDIDDTLFHTNAKIDVIDPMGNVVQSLSNQEYNNHSLPEGYSYNFDQFKDASKFATESNPMDAMLSKVRKIYQNVQNKNATQGTDSKVILSTARSDFDNKDTVIKFFRDHGIPIDEGIHLHRAGNVPGTQSPAEKKNFILQSKYLSPGHNFKSVHFYDDSTKNLDEFLKIQGSHPGVDLKAFHVRPDGSTRTWNQRAREQYLQENPLYNP
jgi:hypothetical protein